MESWKRPYEILGGSWTGGWEIYIEEVWPPPLAASHKVRGNAGKMVAFPLELGKKGVKDREYLPRVEDFTLGEIQELG